MEAQVSNAGSALGSSPKPFWKAGFGVRGGAAPALPGLTGLSNRIKNRFAERPRFSDFCAAPENLSFGKQTQALPRGCLGKAFHYKHYLPAVQPAPGKPKVPSPTKEHFPIKPDIIFFPLMSVDTCWTTSRRNPLLTNSSDTTLMFYEFLLSYLFLLLLLLLFYFISLLRIENTIFVAQECICSCNWGCDRNQRSKFDFSLP